MARYRRHAFPSTHRWQDMREMRSRATGRGKIMPRCVLGRLVVARLCLDAFSGARRWQNAREMRSPGVRRWRDCALMRSWPDWQWQYSRALRSRASIRGKFCAPCIPKVASDGKIAPSWQDSHAMHPKRAGFGKICAPCIRKAPQIAVGGYTARISCQEGALFAARAPRIMHGAQILPSFGA